MQKTNRFQYYFGRRPFKESNTRMRLGRVESRIRDMDARGSFHRQGSPQLQGSGELLCGGEGYLS